VSDKEQRAQAIAIEIQALSGRYMEDNTWFRFYSGGSSFDPATPQTYAKAAGKAYVHIFDRKEDDVPLGDTKLRSDQELVANFGLSDSEGPAPPAAPPPGSSSAPAVTTGPTPVAPLTVAGMSSSSASSGGASSSSSASSSGTPAGAILSNRKWSPMLNDAFILGGVKSGKHFVFVPVGDDATTFNSMSAGAAAGPGASKEQLIRAGAPVWKQFFIRKPYLLWDRGYPRVFARELLGLKKFGYKAVPRGHQLGFEPQPGGEGATATFDLYLEYLKDSQFQRNQEGKEKVLRRIAEFLFEDPTALDPIISG
jgi:hypothetical protein